MRHISVYFLTVIASLPLIILILFVDKWYIGFASWVKVNYPGLFCLAILPHCFIGVCLTVLVFLIVYIAICLLFPREKHQ